MSPITARYVPLSQVFGARAGEEPLLKATKLVEVWIPGYTRDDGHMVAGHHKMVHKADDHDDAKVLAGQGTYSQKNAHAALQKTKFFPQLPAEHQVPVLLKHATELQEKETAKARLSELRKVVLAGGTPSPGQLKYFHALDDQAATAYIQDLKAKGASIEALSALAAGHPLAAAPEAAPSAVEAPSASHVDQEPAPATQAPAITAESVAPVPPEAPPPAEAAAPAVPAAHQVPVDPAAWHSYTKTTGGSNKFWAIAKVQHGDGWAVVTRYGKIGTKGQTLTKHLSSEVSANALVSTMVSAKVQNDYQWTSPHHTPALAAPVEMPAPAAPAAAPAPAGDSSGPPEADAWQKVGGQLGSNSGFVAVDPDGQKWYVKTPNSEAHAQSELLASKLYAAAGVKAAELKPVTVNGKLSLASRWEDNTAKASPGAHAALAGAREGFAVDAWLANWDALGVDSTNIQSVAGNASRIDVGGSLAFRSQGSPKGSAFGTTVGELATLRDPKVNQQTAAVFGGMSDADVAKSIEAHVASMPDDKIQALVEEFGPGSAAEKADLAVKLIKRKQYLEGWASSHLAKPAAPVETVMPSAPSKASIAAKLGDAKLATFGKPATPDSSPKEGDTKQGADGMLVLKDGHWQKVEASIAGKPAYDYLDGAVGDVYNPGAATVAANDWIAANPGAWNELNEGLHQMGYDSLANYGPDEASAPTSEHDTEAAIESAATKDGAMRLAVAHVKAQTTRKGKDAAFFNAALSLKMAGHFATGGEAGVALTHAIANPPAAAAAAPPLAAPEFIEGKTSATAVAWYQKMAAKVIAMADAGDVAGLHALPTDKGKTWQGKTPNSKLLLKLHADALVHAKGGGNPAAAGPGLETPAAAAPALAAAPAAPARVIGAGAPDGHAAVTAAITAHFLPDSNSNAPGTNKKVQAILDAWKKGDAAALQAMSFSTNTYGKKNTKLVATLLAHLGVEPAAAPATPSAPKIVGAGHAAVDPLAWVKLEPGEKVVKTGADYGVEWAQVEVPAKGFDADAFPPLPLFNKSSKAHVNESNAALAGEILAKAKSGKASAADLSAMQFDLISKETGQKIGASESVLKHPASQINELVTQVVAELDAQQHPTMKIVHNGSVAGSYSKAMAGIAQKVKAAAYEKFKAWAHKAADYLVLDKTAGAILAVPPEGQFKETDGHTGEMGAFKAQSNTAFDKMAAPLQNALKDYTGSAYHEWNKAMRKGELDSTYWKSSEKLRQAFDECSQELPEGIVLWRGIGVGGDTYASVVGGVIQDGSVQSCSYGDSPAFSSKETLLRIHVPKGVRAVHATAFSKFGKGEREVILDRQVRYAVVKVTKHDNFKGKHGKKTVVDLIALPHE